MWIPRGAARRARSIARDEGEGGGSHGGDEAARDDLAPHASNKAGGGGFEVLKRTPRNKCGVTSVKRKRRIE